MHSNYKSYTTLQNIIFYLKIWKKSFPVGIFLIVLFVPTTILGIYQKIKIPQIIIRGIELGSNENIIIKGIALTFIIMLVCNVAAKYMQTKIMTRGSRPLIWLYSLPIHNKIFSMNYQQLISDEVQNKLSKVQNIVLRGGDGGPIHFFGVKIASFGVGILGILVFSKDIFKIDWILLIIIFLSAIINLSYGIYAGKYSTKSMRDRSDDEKKELYFTKIAENKDYSKDIRAYNLIEPINQNFNYYHNSHSNYIKKETKVLFGSGVINALTLLIKNSIAYGYLIYKLTSGEILISDFVYLIAIVMQFSLWMDIVVNSINELILFSSQMQQIRDFLNIENIQYHEIKYKFELVSPKTSIEFVELDYKYPDSEKYIFKNFNLYIKPEEKIAIVGINGAGKTTLMHLLTGLLEPTNGKILIDNKDSRLFSKEDYYKIFSPVFQDINIFPETIASNISGSNNYNYEKLQIAIKKADIASFISNLNEKEKTYMVRESREGAIDLSGGIKQRLLLARAIYKDGQIIILDEPTAALDPNAESKMYEEYNKICDGKTSIFISHRLASTRFCNRILFIENGKIIEEGTHESLMLNRGKYYEMYQAQSQYYQDEVI